MKKINILKRVCIVISIVSILFEIAFLISLFQEKLVFPSFLIYIFPVSFIALIGWFFCLKYIQKAEKQNYINLNKKPLNDVDTEITEKSA